MASDLVYGNIEGYPGGSIFASYKELNASGVHRPSMAGIGGSAKSGGADSIVVSGGYEDDEDYGDEIIYTGHGGKGVGSARQTSDQSIEAPGNRALARNILTGNPVRVIRGHKGAPRYSPGEGYRYDGLFRVMDQWTETGRSGFAVIRFRLVKWVEEDERLFEGGALEPSAPTGETEPSRRGTTTLRVVRDSELTRWVKERHRHCCQVCGSALDTPAGLYAEGSHIKPLGRPHNGPDVVENILCLCPNHHVLFDRGAIGVADDGSLIGLLGELRTARGHRPDPELLAYHRQIHGLAGGQRGSR